MDMNAKNPEDWKFGDILAYDMAGDGKPETKMLRMFVYGSGNTFQSLLLNTFGDHVLDISPRVPTWWMRIEKAER